MSDKVCLVVLLLLWLQPTSTTTISGRTINDDTEGHPLAFLCCDFAYPSLHVSAFLFIPWWKLTWNCTIVAQHFTIKFVTQHFTIKFLAVHPWRFWKIFLKKGVSRPENNQSSFQTTFLKSRAHPDSRLIFVFNLWSNAKYYMLV